VLRHYACVRQGDQGECGAAALATVALHYRRPIDLQRLRELPRTSLTGLVQAAEMLGFCARGVKGPYEALPQMPLPAIAPMRTEEGRGHFVVLHRVQKRAVVVADPARGIELLSRDQFCRRWTGELLLLAPEPHALPRDGATPLSPWRRFLGLLRGHRPVLAEAFFCALLMTVLGVATSYFVQHLVDNVLVRYETRLLNALGLGLILVIAFRTLFGVLRQYLLTHVGYQVDLALFSGYARHILGLPLQFFATRRLGEIFSRVHDIAKVREVVSGTTLTAVADSTLVVSLLVVLWLYDLPLAMAATAFIPLELLGVAAHHRASRWRSEETMERGSQLAAHLVENISGVETVKAFGAERARAEEGDGFLLRYSRAQLALQQLSLGMDSLGLLVTGLTGGMILWYGGHRVMSGALTIGQLMFFYALLGYLLEPVQRLASVNVKIQDALVAVDRLYQILDLELEQPCRQSKVLFTGVRQAIELREVSFRYDGRGDVLEKVSLSLPAGKTVAVVGESGSGKSTLLKLLLGFHAPTEGRILIDGVDLRDFDLASLRSRTGLVSQDPFVFNRTVRENIALGRPGAPLEDIIEAVRMAELDEFIGGLPRRYDTVLGERGIDLSGGQRQRLAIARVLLRKPDLLIFDEATSHLDTATERAIQDNLKTALAGRTVVLVAHRLSTINEADYIYMLRGGRVVEEGTPRQLLAADGWYAGLWRAQTLEPLAAQRWDVGRQREAGDDKGRGCCPPPQPRRTAPAEKNGVSHE
jgi:ATP-binding cassette subfamily B protein